MRPASLLSQAEMHAGIVEGMIEHFINIFPEWLIIIIVQMMLLKYNQYHVSYVNICMSVLVCDTFHSI